MKKLLYILILFACCSLSYYMGSHWIYMAADVHSDDSESIMYPHSFDLREAYLAEKEIANALFEGLHRFYSNDDHDDWFTGFAKTKEYAKIDSLLNGNWEDFYYYETPPLEDWFSVYGTAFEPSESYKDSIQFGLKKLQL